MTNQSQVFVSAINGAKFDVNNALTTSLLSKNEKKEIIHRAKSAQGKAGKGKAKPETPDDDDIEQDVK